MVNIVQSRNDIPAATDFVKMNASQYQIHSNSLRLWMSSLGGKHFVFLPAKMIVL